jgi:hypothetical protein
LLLQCLNVPPQLREEAPFYIRQIIESKDIRWIKSPARITKECPRQAKLGSSLLDIITTPQGDRNPRPKIFEKPTSRGQELAIPTCCVGDTKLRRSGITRFCRYRTSITRSHGPKKY